MTEKTFAKTLSPNDVGETDAHMGGILVPKGDGELLAFLPPLDPGVLNPSAWIDCITPDGQLLRLRFVYYNNKLHAPKGTRNEYRITWLTKFLREAGAKSGDTFQISREYDDRPYRIEVVPAQVAPELKEEDGPVRIRLLSSSWHRLH